MDYRLRWTPELTPCEIVTTSLNGVITVVLVGDNVDTSKFIEDGLQPIHDNLLIATP